MSFTEGLLVKADPYLGAFSGKVYLEEAGGKLVPERMGDENAIGAAKTAEPIPSATANTPTRPTYWETPPGAVTAFWPYPIGRVCLFDERR